MQKIILFFVFMLIPLPSLAKTYVMPSGKVMEEKITYHHTLSGLQVAVSQWVEVLGAIKKAEASEDSQEDVIKNYIRSLSDLAGIDGDFMIKLADCESGFNPDAKGDFRGKIYMAHGLFQWWEKSWKHYNKKKKFIQIPFLDQKIIRIIGWGTAKKAKKKTPLNKERVCLHKYSRES